MLLPERMAMIESHVKALKKSFGKMRLPIPESAFRELHAKKDYMGMINRVKKSMSLDMRHEFNIVDSGGPEGTENFWAWIGLPASMPPVGTPAFRSMMLTLRIRKEFIQNAPYGTLVACLAHELSHVVLRATENSLFAVEEAVDLTAMLLGFQDYFIKYSFFRVDACTIIRRGYLTRDEYIYAASLMARE